MNELQHDAHVKTHFECKKPYWQWAIDRDNAWLREDAQKGIISQTEHDVYFMPENQQLDATWLWDKFKVADTNNDPRNIRYNLRNRIVMRCVAYRATKRKLNRLNSRAQKALNAGNDCYIADGVFIGIAHRDCRD